MSRSAFALLVGFLVIASAGAEPPARPGVFTVMEDDAEGLLKVLNNPWGDPGQGIVEETDTFSGPRCIKIIPLQRYTNLAGWELKIREKPGEGEYRFVRFAWKSAGGAGIMLQLADTDWNIRYVAGQNTMGWAAKSVADRAPEKWTVVTRDLHADWGDRNIKGIALTAFDGQFALFDHIHFARSVADLDRIDATRIREKPVQLSKDDLNAAWGKLASEDEREAYHATWKLAADPARALPFLRERLPVAVGRTDPKQLAAWVKELDHEKFATRENARKMLEKHLDEAAGLLRRELEGTTSAEARRRIERLLQQGEGPRPELLRLVRAVRVLELIDTPDSRAWLAALAKGADGSRVTVLAREAMARVSAGR